MCVRKLIAVILLGVASRAQQAPEQASNQTQDKEPRLKTRELPGSAPRSEQRSPNQIWIAPAGTRIPIQLRQPISTKSARPGDPIYAQTTFPILIDGSIVIPAGTWVQGAVDTVKRAGRVKGTAELQFHLTTLIYANGYSLSIAAAIDQVPGASGMGVKEPGTVKRDSEKGKDLERVGDAAVKGGQIGALSGAAARPSIRGFGVGGVSGIAAGTLIALLARGTDVTFDSGTAVEIVLSQAMAIEPDKVNR